MFKSCRYIGLFVVLFCANGLVFASQEAEQDGVVPAIAYVTQTLPEQIAQAREAVAQDPESAQKKTELMALLKKAALLNYLAQQQK